MLILANSRRHPSESWDPLAFRFQGKVDPSFRWDDGMTA
jgi:hypothetical protein